MQPTHALIGSTDLERTVAFLTTFGFTAADSLPVDATAAHALYGLEGPTEEVVMSAPDTQRGWIRLVRTPLPASDHGPFDVGGHALDLYTRDVDESLRVARAAGAACGPVVRYELGPLQVGELKAVGPDHLAVVFIEISRRRPSTLDLDGRLHSELHSAVWTVADVDAVLPFWREQAGMSTLLDMTVREPAVAAFMGLPRPDTPLRLTVLADASGGAPRFEMIHFPEHPGPAPATWPLRPGLHALGVTSAEPASVAARLSAVEWGQLVRVADGGTAVAGLAPGGVRLQVRQA
jgi:catechol 2,3-dioxygenase-like lactoylglutathione lyase family enzyme